MKLAEVDQMPIHADLPSDNQNPIFKGAGWGQISSPPGRQINLSPLNHGQIVIVIKGGFHVAAVFGKNRPELNAVKIFSITHRKL